MPLQRKQNSKLLWILIGGLSILVVLFFAAQWFFKKTESSAPLVDPQPVSTPAPAKPKPAEPLPSSEPLAENASSQQLVSENVLKEPVPAQESLAKEEVSKLEDIHRQLKDQEATLKAQHADADQLTKLKEEQVKLLEAQLKQQ
ncbi:hypothetical protein BE1S18E01_04410 [Acinetobacter sp. BEC1-S18-ESBL-01]|jgi:hypothetical protein|uniref:Uncharacterized protein n=3 Tax=Acinetobacter TaxID=469 RepID=A0A1T0N6L7_ACIPI|nr:MULTISPECIES: hypothetical protein [Acinetobacter]AMO39628.1 hypothetical protein A0J50_02165 [Acinetobacter sp. DUT-2]AQV14339.1 hypothetical protein BMU11_01720 [Acinetobacter pittii]AVZ03590.1 hypothetical protein DBQ26_02360 [Acinetobacter pittii]ENW13446.1 hypothetical protein F930_01011 [Acinetobacter pittii ANC 3678]EXC28445.1 hypothetical protein J536_1676 [Acinetobacter sp. 809848]